MHYYKVGTHDGKTNDELIQISEELAAAIGLIEKNQIQTEKGHEFVERAFKHTRPEIFYV